MWRLRAVSVIVLTNLRGARETMQCSQAERHWGQGWGGNPGLLPSSSTASQRSLPPYWLSWQSGAWKMLFGDEDEDDWEVNGAVAA